MSLSPKKHYSCSNILYCQSILVFAKLKKMVHEFVSVSPHHPWVSQEFTKGETYTGQHHCPKRTVLSQWIHWPDPWCIKWEYFFSLDQGLQDVDLLRFLLFVQSQRIHWLDRSMMGLMTFLFFINSLLHLLFFHKKIFFTETWNKCQES